MMAQLRKTDIPLPSIQVDVIEFGARARRGKLQRAVTQTFGFRPSDWSPIASLNGILSSMTHCSWLPQSSMATGFSAGPS